MTNHDLESSRPSQHEAALERAWRAASTEQPPSHLDAAIIAAARKSVPYRGEQRNPAPARMKSRNWLARWQPLAAAATVAGLAFVLVQLLPQPHDLGPSLQRRESAPVPELAEPPPDSSSSGEASDTGPSAGTAAPLGEIGSERLKAVGSEMADRAATAAAAAPSSPARESSFDNAVPLDAAAWAAKVAALHGSGAIAAAEDALREFRAAYPDADAQLPDSLRDWARTVK
jgi:hypothetical protein